MRGFKTLALVATASVLLAGSLQAQWKGQVKWGSAQANTRTDYRSSLSPTGWQGHQTNSAPYRASFLNVAANGPVPATWYTPPSGYGTYIGANSSWGPTVDIFCVDLLHYANTGTYYANFTNLANTDLLGNTTRLGGTDGQMKYWQAAYLAQKISKETVGSQLSKDMTGAIWAIMSGRTLERNENPDFGTTNWVGGGIATQVADAQKNYGNGSVRASDWVVVTATDANGNKTDYQEYITQVTPEPATMLLLGTGLVVMLMAAGALRRPVA